MYQTTHLKHEWKEQAKIDYFSHFLALWVGFNSWYNHYYKDYDYKSTRGKIIENKQDCHYISILKTEFHTPENELFNTCYNLLYERTKNALKFKSDIAALHYSLNSVENLLYYDQLGNSYKITFNFVNIEAFDRKPNYVDLIEEISEQEEENTIEEENKYVDLVIDDKYTAILDSYGVIMSVEEFFAGIIEILYKVRCAIVHGVFNPQDEYNYEVVKYCYYILLALME